MATRAQQSYVRPVTAAIAEGATTPDPGVLNAVVLSTTTGAFMRWTSTIWTAIGEPGPEGPSGGNAVQAEVDFGFSAGQEGTEAHATVSAAWVGPATVLVASPAAVATADHDPDDAWAEGITAYATAPVDGVGFDVYATAPSGTWGRYLINVLAV